MTADVVAASQSEHMVRVPAIVAGAGVAATAFATGAYFPSSWGWVATGVLWVAVVALLFHSSPRVPLLGIQLAGLVLLALVMVGDDAAAPGVREVQRLIVYVGAVLVVMLLLRAQNVSQFLAGVLVGTTFACTYGLASRLLPDRIGEFDPIAQYRLSEPLGYWNALGLFATLGLLLATGLGARTAAPLARGLAAASCVPLALALYFTFSRGAWIALFIGAATTALLDRGRISWLTLNLPAVGAAGGATVYASTFDALTRPDAPLTSAADAGTHVAAVAAVCAIAALTCSAVVTSAAARVRIPRSGARIYRAVLAAAALVMLGSAFMRFGAPWTVARNAWESFKTPPPSVVDLNDRLYTFSSNGRVELWEAAWKQFRENPLIGSGAGTYERFWLEHRHAALKVRDAHSLYLETLAELGIVGLTLLLIALLVPVYAAFKARHRPLVPAAFGAYVAYLVHAGVDWDWEMPAVTLTALFIGASIVVAARKPEDEERPMGPRLRYSLLAGTLVLAAVAFVGLVGNMSLAQSAEAARAADFETAEAKARRAVTWAPWSPEPWQAIGRAQLARGDVGSAAASFRKAIAKDEGDWNLWLDLARATQGAEQQAAISRALALNPLSPEIAQLRKELGETGVIEVAEEEKR